MDSASKKEQEIIEGLKPVCICKGIKQRTFVQEIRAGMTSLEELQKATGAGSGSCKGERCTPKIEELLKKYKEEATAKTGLAQRRKDAKEGTSRQSRR